MGKIWFAFIITWNIPKWKKKTQETLSIDTMKYKNLISLHYKDNYYEIHDCRHGNDVINRIPKHYKRQLLEVNFSPLQSTIRYHSKPSFYSIWLLRNSRLSAWKRCRVLTSWYWSLAQDFLRCFPHPSMLRSCPLLLGCPPDASQAWRHPIVDTPTTVEWSQLINEGRKYSNLWIMKILKKSWNINSKL